MNVWDCIMMFYFLCAWLFAFIMSLEYCINC